MSCELHTFSDASEHACAAVIYLRVKYKGGRIVIWLVMAKTILATRRTITLKVYHALGSGGGFDDIEYHPSDLSSFTTLKARLLELVRRAQGEVYGRNWLVW